MRSSPTSPRGTSTPRPPDGPAMERSEIGAGARLGIYRLVPTAARNDRRFARDAFHGEIVVRAFSPADARIVASEAEAACLEEGASADSPFRDPALYTVIEVPAVGFLRPGKRGVVTGRFVARPVAG